MGIKHWEVVLDFEGRLPRFLRTTACDYVDSLSLLFSSWI